MKNVALCLSVMAVALACNRVPKMSEEDAFKLVNETHALDSAWCIDLNLGSRNMPRPASGFRMLREDGYLNYADPDVHGLTFVSLTEKGKRFVMPGGDSSRVKLAIPNGRKILCVSDTLEGNRHVKIAYLKVILDSVSPFSVCQDNFDKVMLYQRKFVELNGKWVDHGGAYLGPLQMTQKEARELAMKGIDDYGHLNIQKQARWLTKDSVYQELAKRGYLILDSNSKSMNFVTITGKGREFVELPLKQLYYRVRTSTCVLDNKIRIDRVMKSGRRQTVLSYRSVIKDTTPFFSLNPRSNPYIGFIDTYEPRGWNWHLVDRQVY